MKLEILSAKSKLKAIAPVIASPGILSVACGGGDSSVPAIAPTLGGSSGAGQILMGGGALGGNARAILLARVQLEEMPVGALAWMTLRYSLAAGESLSHNRPFAFVSAERGPRRDIRPVHRQRRHDHLPVRHPVHRQATSFRAAGLLKRQHRRVGD